MNVMYCGDKNIKDGLIISVLSLLKNVSEPLNIYVLTLSLSVGGKVCEPLPAAVTDFLDGYVKKVNGGCVQLIDAGGYFKDELPYANLQTRFTPCCMLRLFADKIPVLPDKILYLDNDVICCKDPREFYYQDLTGCHMAGVLDYYGRWFFRNNVLKADYLNSGVLLLNLKLIRETGLFAKCRNMCRVKRMFMPDQSAINKLTQNKKIMPRCFNEQRRLKSDTVFQHFTTSFRFFPFLHTVTVKPWQRDKMHSKLKLYEYDSLLTEYETLKNECEGEICNAK